MYSLTKDSITLQKKSHWIPPRSDVIKGWQKESWLQKIQVLCDELLHLCLMGVFKPITRSDLTQQCIRDYLYTISLVKENHEDSIKGRTCANDVNQRGLHTE